MDEGSEAKRDRAGKEETAEDFAGAELITEGAGYDADDKACEGRCVRCQKSKSWGDAGLTSRKAKRYSSWRPASASGEDHP